MKRFVSTALLCAAAVSSIATSEIEDYPTSGPHDIAVGRYETYADVPAGGSATRTFDVAIPMADLADVVDSQVHVTATATTASGWSDVLGTVSGDGGTGSMELFADSTNAYSETVIIPDALDGCTNVNGWCVATWTVQFQHTDGTQAVSIDYAFQATIVGPNTNVDVTASF